MQALIWYLGTLNQKTLAIVLLYDWPHVWLDLILPNDRVVDGSHPDFGAFLVEEGRPAKLSSNPSLEKYLRTALEQTILGLF